MTAQSTSVSIRGDGVAAYCCAHVLKAAGCRVTVERVTRPRLPAIMLSDAALELIRDVFGQPGLFRSLPRVRQRVVVWGEARDRRVFEHSAVVISEELLSESLRQSIPIDDDFTDADWTLYASRPLPSGAGERRFGSRTASAAQVELQRGSKDGIDSSACWIESLEGGWLFLIPTAPASGWLLSVGGPVESLLEQSRAIAERIIQIDSSTGAFPASPRIATPLCAPGWLACGTAAIAFDPICGDGTAHAIREAILASAVIRAAANTEDHAKLLAHYQTRLTLGFQRHLSLCADYYRTGHSGPWWNGELASLEQGLDWCDHETRGRPVSRYQLNGFDLTAMN